MILGLKDYEIATAENLEEAAATAQKQHYDVAFVDLRFNGKEIGIDILAKLKEIDPSIEVIICTAYASEKSKIRAVQLGAMDYISKPFMMEVIYELVDRVMERRSKKK
jgi:DNA-binding NtrC family response regulator